MSVSQISKEDFLYSWKLKEFAEMPNTTTTEKIARIAAVVFLAIPVFLLDGCLKLARMINNNYFNHSPVNKFSPVYSPAPTPVKHSPPAYSPKPSAPLLNSNNPTPPPYVEDKTDASLPPPPAFSEDAQDSQDLGYLTTPPPAFYPNTEAAEQ
jgi:hypothetical protein